MFVLDDDLSLKCYALVSKLKQGADVKVTAQKLLVEPKQYADGCIVLIGELYKSGQFSSSDLWAQVRLAAQGGYPDIAKRIASLEQDPAPRALIEQAIQQPERFLQNHSVRTLSKTQKFELSILALAQIARNDIDQALIWLPKIESQFNAEQKAIAWSQIALHAARQLKSQANEYWQRAGNAPLTPLAYEWRVRSALHAENWGMVRKSIEAMPEELRKEPSWTYWLARALQQEKKADSLLRAQQLLASISDRYDFYGQLALEELGEKIVIPPTAEKSSKEEIAEVSKRAGLQNALLFFKLNLRFEALREWNWELRSMNDRQLLAAAEFAKQQGVLDRMVNTSSRTRLAFDFNQRFPTPFAQIVYAHSRSLDIDPAWVYGIIRQESRFVMAARSYVGASGLMQIMPATAKQVARKIGLPDVGNIHDLETNIMLGTNYLQMTLKQMGGSQALASAAYNAGPGRPQRWRNTFRKPVEGAIFAEIIPFGETRDYVKNVLSNATYYSALMSQEPQSLKERLGVVSPFNEINIVQASE